VWIPFVRKIKQESRKIANRRTKLFLKTEEHAKRLQIKKKG
jgi:hypothetical protein